MKEQYDVLIVGAGPAGIYLGWELAKKEIEELWNPVEKMEFTLTL